MKIIKNNKNLIIVILVIIGIIIISTVSYTFAYFAFESSNNNTITGDEATAKIELYVDKVIPTTENENLKLVPLLNSAVGSAVAGTGGQSSCIDENGNLSCQIYKITVKNTGTTNLNMRGTIELTAVGDNNVFDNLKWQELEDVDTAKTNPIINSMSLSDIDSNLYLTPNSTKIYYFALWISEINEDQSLKDYGRFEGTVEFNDVNGNGATATFNNYSPW